MAARRAVNDFVWAVKGTALAVFTIGLFFALLGAALILLLFAFQLASIGFALALHSAVQAIQ